MEPEVIKQAEGIKPSQPLPATTTEQEDMVKSGQRNVNLIWETTQSRIALISIVSNVTMNVIVIAAMLIRGGELSALTIAMITASLAAMNLTVGIIIGFYFSRTNHSAIGGVGKKEQPSDAGTR